MAESARSFWRNCAGQPDDEIRAIDAMEDALGPLDEQTRHIRALITCLESCHHRVLRRVQLIIEAIGAGQTAKGPGRRPAGQVTPREVAWRDAVELLGAWAAGREQDVRGSEVEGIPASDLLAALGERTPLKVWLARRLADRIGQYVDPKTMWREHPVIEVDGATDAMDLRKAAAATMIRDTVRKQAAPHPAPAGAAKDEQDLPWYENPASISLAAAIDNFKGCNWNFPRNLLIVCKAIGGNLDAGEPYAACARNVDLSPARPRLKKTAQTLEAYCGNGEPSTNGRFDAEIVRTLGPRTPLKQWLAASLAKTIRLQLHL
jgi:hypothetical protein